MVITCPSCHESVELADSDRCVDVHCPSCGSTFRVETESTATWRPKEKVLGRFRLIRTVGSGGFGTVYEANDPQLDRRVAIKIPRAASLVDGEDLDRFIGEGRAVARLRHPAIVPVHEVGTANNMPYLVSDFIDGPSLSDVLGTRELPIKEAVPLVAVMADALDYAHKQGIVHRDVKPSNILFDAEGNPHLMDFGLAKRDAGEVTVTQDGQVLGTPAYMSPEQARGEGHHVDGRTDIYSLGVLLYRLFAGQLPFTGNTRMLLHQVLHDEPRPPRKLNDRIARDLETICLKAMAKEPERRYGTASELADDLRRYQRGEVIRARPTGPLERIWRWCRRNQNVAALLGVLTITVLLGFSGVTAALIRSEANRKLAVMREKESAKSLDAALAAVDEYLNRVTESELGEISGAEEVQRSLLESGLGYYQAFASEHAGDSRFESRVARSYVQIAKVLIELDRHEEKDAVLSKARVAYEHCLTRDANDQDLLAGLADTFSLMGLHGNSLAIWRGLIEREPKNTQVVLGFAAANERMADKREPAEALKSLETVEEVLDRTLRTQPESEQLNVRLGSNHFLIAEIAWALKDYQLATMHYQRGRDVFTRIVAIRGEIAPLSLKYQDFLGSSEFHLAKGLRTLGRREDSVAAMRRSLEIYDRLVTRFPSRSAFYVDFANCSCWLASDIRETGRLDEAFGIVDAAKARIQQMPMRDGRDWFHKARALDNLATEIRYLGLAPGAIPGGESGSASERRFLKTAQEGLEALRNSAKLGFANPKVIKANASQLKNITNLPEYAILETEFGRGEFGLQRSNTKLKSNPKAEQSSPSDMARSQVLAHQTRVAMRLLADGQQRWISGSFEEGAGKVREAIALYEEIARSDPTNHDCQTELSAALLTMAELELARVDRPYLASAWSRSRSSMERALAIRQREHALNSSEIRRTQELAWVEGLLGHLYLRAGLPGEALGWLDRSLDRFPRFDAHFGVWLNAAFAHLAMRDIEGYKAICKRMEKSALSTFPHRPWQIMLACTLAPGAPPVDRWRGQMESEFDSTSDANTALGVALLMHDFRGARYERAEHFLNRWRPTWLEPHIGYSAVLTMLHQKAGRAEQAESARAVAEKAWSESVKVVLQSEQFQPPADPKNHLVWLEGVCFQRELDEFLGRSSEIRDLEIRLLEGRALAALGLPERARTVIQPLSIPPDQTWLQVAAIRALAEAGDGREAFGRLGRLAEAHLGEVELQRSLAHIAVKHGELQLASELFLRVLALEPEDQFSTLYAVLCLRLSGSTERSSQVCTLALNKARATGDPARMFDAALPSAVLDVPLGDQDAIERAHVIANQYPESRMGWSWLTGLARYRAARHDEAFALLKEAEDLGLKQRWDGLALVWLPLALVEQARGHDAEARKLLDRAVKDIEQRLAAQAGGPSGQCPFRNSQDWLYFQLLRHESEIKILDAYFPKNPFAADPRSDAN